MLSNLYSELKRRNVLKVALTYTVIAWLLIQLALVPALDDPSHGSGGRGGTACEPPAPRGRHQR